jgi:hypothetical protein
MKKFEAKTMLLLTLPALALVGFASVLPLRNTKRDLGAPYMITQHRLLRGVNSLTDEHKQMASYHCPKLNLKNCVVYETEVESRRASWFEKWMHGDNDSHANLSAPFCIETKSGKIVALVASIAINGGDNGSSVCRVENFYDLRSLKKSHGQVQFSTQLEWKQSGRQFTRQLTKKILPANLKEGIQ